MRDLHLHTNFSDGNLTPTQLVAEAAQRGIKEMAVTDHDGVSGIEEAQAAGRKTGITVIPAVEISSTVEGDMSVHILGYGIDKENPAFRAELDVMIARRRRRNEKLIRALQDQGADLDWSDVFLRPDQDYAGKPNFALALLKKGYIQNVQDAYLPGRYLGHPSVTGIHKEKIAVERAIRMIRDAGGWAVLAHPLKIKALKPNTDGYARRLAPVVDRLLEMGVSGMECYYSQHTPADVALLRRMAREKGLFATAGSDYHGPGMNWVKHVGDIPCMEEAEKEELPFL